MSKSKFFDQLTESHKGIREQRAKNLSERAKMEQEEYIRNLEKKEFDLKDKIDQLSDLGPESTMSLKNPDVSAKDWVQNMNKAELELELLKRELKIAQRVSKEWFGE